MRLTIAVEPDEDRFRARCIEIPGTLCEADSADAAVAEVRAAVRLMVRCRREEARRVQALLRTIDIDLDAPLAAR
jgi:hypothetical protein